MPIVVQVSPKKGAGMVRISETVAKRLSRRKVGRVTHQPPGGNVYNILYYTHERNLTDGKTGLTGPKRYLRGIGRVREST